MSAFKSNFTIGSYPEKETYITTSRSDFRNPREAGKANVVYPSNSKGPASQKVQSPIQSQIQSEQACAANAAHACSLDVSDGKGDKLGNPTGQSNQMGGKNEAGYENKKSNNGQNRHRDLLLIQPQCESTLLHLPRFTPKTMMTSKRPGSTSPSEMPHQETNASKYNPSLSPISPGSNFTSYTKDTTKESPAYTLPPVDYHDTQCDASKMCTKISNDLEEKLKKYPASTIIPLFVQNISESLPGYNEAHWKWQDKAYVRLPLHPANKVQSLQRRIDNIENNWDNIEITLRKVGATFQNNAIQADLSRVMNSVVTTYCADAGHVTNFGMLSRPDLQNALRETIPIIVEHALNLPKLLSAPIPIFKSGDNKTIYLSRKLCSSLLANAFFCTFPEPTRQLQMPDFNFLRLFNDTNTNRCEVKKEKIKCILNYFQVVNNMDEDFQNDIVSFERRNITSRMDWENSNMEMCDVLVELDGQIEDADGMLQVDFANKVIGGGVLNDGSVMEEIRFCISPELIVSRLFTETMNDDEVVVINGSQIFSKYSGYSTSFRYAGTRQRDWNCRPKDNLGRTCTEIVALDALSFKKSEAEKQYQKHCIDRELHKCYVAFIPREKISPIATGNWGCGAFNGNTELKFCIQWMAASQHKRPVMQYHTVKDHRLSQRMKDMTSFLQTKNVKVGQLYKTVTQFGRQVEKNPNASLFQFVKDKFGAAGMVGINEGLGILGNGLRGNGHRR